MAFPFVGPGRRSPRYPGFDYSTTAGYFVTVCTFGRLSIFGNIKNQVMVLNENGKIILDCWLSLPERYPFVSLDDLVIMPNHVHGIIWLDNPPSPVGTIHELSLPKRRRKMVIPIVIGYFKMQTAKRINILQKSFGDKIWQRSYHDRIIRNERELFAIRNYIKNNPKNWESDEYASGLTH